MGTRKKQFWIPIVALLATIAAGCIDNDKTMVIVFAGPLDDNCAASVQSSDGNVFLSSGILDLGHPYFNNEPVYYLYPQVHNYLVSSINIDIHELEAMTIQIEKATVTYEWLPGSEEVLEASADLAPLLMLENDFEVTTYLSGTIGPGGEDGKPGQMVIGVRLITRDVGNLLTILQHQTPRNLSKLTLGAHLRIEGHTLGGRKIVSNDFVFPIEFCWGCLSYACLDENGNVIGYPACDPGQTSNSLECEN
ncbi:MAG: hypothetical protein JRJ87_11750 [Deltaproteobacteria bacterium]|nr:hypothetical protein [Deltaproteobacteria bacterium]